MKKSLRLIAFVIAAGTVTTVLPVVATHAQAPAAAVAGNAGNAGNAVNGKALYYAHGCYGCHGFNGETGTKFVGNPTKNLTSEANFITFLRLRADQAPLTPQTRMPNFPENAINDRQAKDIYAFIRSMKGNTPELKDIPTLNTIIDAASRPYKP